MCKVERRFHSAALPVRDMQSIYPGAVIEGSKRTKCNNNTTTQPRVKTFVFYVLICFNRLYEFLRRCSRRSTGSYHCQHPTKHRPVYGLFNFQCPN